MFNIYLKIALRFFRRHKVHTLINLIGLTMGMVCTLLILLYVSYEMSYDVFQANKQNLYRVNKASYENGKLNYKSAYTFSGQGPVMKSEIPEVTDYVRLLHSKGVIQYFNSKNDPVSFREKDIYFADASFFNLFSYRLINGDAQSVLLNPNSMVLSESTAKKYFASENPIGKIIKYDNDNFIVTGIYEDIPKNTHLTFSALISFSSLKISDSDSWSNHAFYTYILLKDKTNPIIIEPKLSQAFEIYLYKYWNKNISNNWELQRVDNIYLYSTDFTSISMEYGNYKTVLYLAIIAFLVLIIAWINFINLSTARLPDRAKEIGIRKTVGASRKQLTTQFVFESILINLGAVVASWAIVQSSLQWFNQFLGINISLFQSSNNWLWGVWILLFLIGISLTSIYPALQLTAMPATAAIKKYLNSANNGYFLRKVLITFQFSISVALIIVTFIMSEQLSFTKNKNLGINIDDVLVIRTPDFADQQTADLAFERFKQMAVINPAIRNATISRSIPGERFGSGNAGGIRKEGSGIEEQNYFRIGRIDPSFVDLFELKLLAGSNFSYEHMNRDAFIINREAMNVLGFTDPKEAIGIRLKYGDRLYNIVGVTENFHQESFHRTIEPIILYTDAFHQSINYISLKLSRMDVKKTLSFIEATYKTIFPGQPYDCFFLDDFFNRQYRTDENTGRIISAFAFLAVLIAVLGLFSLMSYVAAKRTKEIGIRKVVGATIPNIVSLLTKDYIKWVLVANLIAWPVAYYLMNKWLQDFAYRIEISWWVFVLSGGIALLIAFATVSYQAIKAASANPINSLKYE